MPPSIKAIREHQRKAREKRAARLKREYGWFTGSASLKWLRSEPRYPALDKVPLVGYWFRQWAPREIYECTPTPGDPLTFHSVSGWAVRLYKTIESDKGSVPSIITPICADDRWLWPWLLHDLEFEPDHAAEFIHEDAGGLPIPEWVPEAALSLGLGDSAILRVTRDESDNLMWAGIRAQGGTWLQAMMIYRLVHAFGRTTWEK